MTEEQAEARFRHQLSRRKRDVEHARDALAEAEERLASYEKNKSDYITYYKALP